MKIRPDAVAGQFYPAQSDLLEKEIDGLLATAHPRLQYQPKALIVPHAGLIYSGRVASAAYREIVRFRKKYSRVVLIGPAHRVAFYGLALSSASAFHTPLGNVELANTAADHLEALPQVIVYDQAHDEEHSLEVQLPFLQSCLDRFELLPLVVGESSASEVAEVLGVLWGGPETLVIASSDLSHFLDYREACMVDRQTSQKIMNYATDLGGEEACGCKVLNGLSMLAREKHLHIDMLALENSGDTAGNRSRVVGYGAYALH